MKTSTAVWIVVIIVVVLGGWWWYSSSNSAAPAPTPTPAVTDTTPTPPPAPSVALGTGSTTTIGTFMTGDNGMTLYTFDKDSVGTSTCYGQCAQNWPAYTVAQGTQVTPPAGATGQIATITRADGSIQVTYNGMPLYFYAKDTNAGDTTGNGVGKVWHVAKP
ncbi:MAG: hypothetical protein KGI70_03490 [Patescibacteria group bacterium]|nr:hypothetical protein [Patescibacteria group bacterium]